MKNYILKGSMLSLATALLLGMSGCGSSSSDETQNNDEFEKIVTSISTSGSVVDGYLAYSTICLDLNKDDICQVDKEPTTQTDQNGNYSLEITAKQQENSGFDSAPLLVYGGYDLDTNIPFIGKLKSPFQQDKTSNVTPITAMVQAMVEEGSSLSDAKTQVQKFLGLDSDVDLFADPVTIASTKPELLSSALQLQKSVEVLAGATTSSADNINNVAEKTYAQIAQKLKSGDINSLDDAIDAIAPNSNVAVATKELVAQVQTLSNNGVVSTKELATRIHLMQNEIKTKIIDGHETTVSFDDIISLDIFTLEAKNILTLADYTVNSSSLVDSIASLLKRNNFSTTSPLSLEDEVNLLKSSSDSNLESIAAVLEEKINLFKQTNSVVPIETTAVSNSALIGSWVASTDEVPFGLVLVVTSDNKYFMTQQILGDGGTLGGVEVGTYTPTQDGSFGNAIPMVNTNGGDTAVGMTANYQDDAIPTLKMATSEGTTLVAKKLVATQEHPETGSWIHWLDDGSSFFLLTFDGNGHYMYSDVDLQQNRMVEIDGSYVQNTTEFGTYSIATDGSVTITPDDATSPETCDLDGDNTHCGDIAGDTNGKAGFGTATEQNFNNLKFNFTADQLEFSFDSVGKVTWNFTRI